MIVTISSAVLVPVLMEPGPHSKVDMLMIDRMMVEWSGIDRITIPPFPAKMVGRLTAREVEEGLPGMAIVAWREYDVVVAGQVLGWIGEHRC